MAARPGVLPRHNIGPLGVRWRRRFGHVAFAIGVAAAAWLIVAGAPTAWRLGLFLPFVLAGIGWFQAQART